MCRGGRTGAQYGQDVSKGNLTLQRNLIFKAQYIVDLFGLNTQHVVSLSLSCVVGLICNRMRSIASIAFFVRRLLRQASSSRNERFFADPKLAGNVFARRLPLLSNCASM